MKTLIDIEAHCPGKEHMLLAHSYSDSCKDHFAMVFALQLAEQIEYSEAIRFIDHYVNKPNMLNTEYPDWVEYWKGIKENAPSQAED